MRKGKRLLAGLLALLMVLTCVPVYDMEVRAAEFEDFEYEVNDDGESVTITEYKGNGGKVTVPSEIDGKSVTSIGAGTFWDCSDLTSVTIPSSVISIESDAFSNCSGLTSITIPSSVTSIESFAFVGCSSLRSITIPEGVTSIGEKTFSECSSLTSVTIPSSVTSIDDCAFYVCSSLTSVTIPSSVVSIGWCAFADCSGLTNVTISEGVTSIENEAFSGCSSLTSVIIPSSVVSIGYGAFEDCSSLTNIKVETGNTTYDSRGNCNAIIETASNTLISGCKNTKIPSSVTGIGEFAFGGCKTLASVTIPSSVMSIGDEAFWGCSSLTSVTIPSSVTSIGDFAFEDCSGLTDIKVEARNTIYDSREDCSAIIETADNILILGCKNTTIPNSVTSIGAGAFSGCSGLKSVTIPSSVTSIDDYAFYVCSSLKRVTIPSSVTSIGFGSFGYCYLGDGEEKVLDFTIYGKRGTAAEAYAKENEFKFICNTAEIDSSISVSKGNSAVKIIDGKTGEPISNARVWTNKEQFTDEKGMVELSQTGLTTIQIEKKGYRKKTVKKKLNKGQCSVVILCPDTGDLQVFSATLNLSGEDEDILDNTVSLFDKDLKGDTNVIAADFSLRVEAAGNPVKYQLIQNGKVLQTSTDGTFKLSGRYSNSKKGKISYYVDGLSAGYGVSVRIFDSEGKKINQKLGIKVSKASSSVWKVISEMEGSDSVGKVEFGDGTKVTLPDSVPILGGTELKFGFEEKLPIQVSMDSDTGLVRVALNMGEFDTSNSAKWYDKKQEFKKLETRAKSLSKSAVAFGGKPEPFSASLFSVNGSIMGYGEGYLLDNSDSLCVSLKVVVSIRGEGKYKKYAFIPIYLIPVPVYVKFSGGISCGVSGEVNLEFGGSGVHLNGGNLEFEPSIYIKPEAGIGADGVLSLSACGKIDVTWLYRYLNNYSRVTLSGDAKLKGTVLDANKEWDIWSGTAVVYETKQKTASDGSGKAKLASSYLDMSDAELISMDYLAWRAEGAADSGISAFSLAATGNSDSVRILDYAYENASPRLVQAGGKLYLFYLDGVEGRSEQNQTSLFYRISTDGGSTWTEARRADGGANETADYDFDVAVNGNEIYVVWSDAGKVYGDEILSMGASEMLAEIGKGLDLMISVIDAGTGNVKRKTLIGTNNADVQPQVAADDGGAVYVAWISNDVSSENGLISNENQMGICYASSEDGYTVHSAPLQEGFYPLTLDIGMLDSEMWIAAGIDTDADLNTQEDREIYTMDLKSEGMLSAKTSDEVVDSVPVFGKAGGEDCLFWYHDGNIAYTPDVGPVISDENVRYIFDSENLPSMGQEFSLLESNNGNASIVWASTSLTEDLGVDVYCTDFDGNAWSNVYRLGSLDSEYTGKLSGYMDVSGCQMAYLGSNYEDDGLRSHISLYTPEDRTDTSIVWYAEDGKKQGESYPLHMTVTNNGNKVVENLSIFSEDDSIQDEITGITIEPGSSKEITWDGIRLPEEMTEVYTANLTVMAEGEKNTEDNTIELSVGEPDLSVEAYQDFSSGERLAGIEVTNNGILASDAVLTVYKDEEHKQELYKTSLQGIAGGESRIALFDLSVMDEKAQTFYFVVSDTEGKESYIEDNEVFLYTGKGMYLEYEDEKPEPEPEPEKPEPDKKPTTTYTYKLNSDKTTITITKCTTTAENVVIPSSIDGYTVTGIDDKAFQNVTSMKTVSFPSTLKNIGVYAFTGCTSLTAVSLPDSLEGLGNYAFTGCTSLKSVKLNAGRINVSEGLFQGCTSLSSVVFPDSVLFIREYAFQGCTSLKTLNLPQSLWVVYDNAFLNSGIKSIKYTGTSIDWGMIKIHATGNTVFLNATVTGSNGKTFSANKSKWNTGNSSGNTVKKPSVSKVKSFKAKAGKKKLKLTWKKVSGAAGYQIQISTKKNFKGAKKISISKSKKTYTKKGLKAKKKYYIRIRAYKTYKDANKKTKKVYGKWVTISKKTK